MTDGARTRDNQYHKLALYQLNYGHHKISGAGDEGRTRDIQLGRLTLYQLSYSRIFWSVQQDLNLRPPAPKAGALPSCAIHRYFY